MELGLELLTEILSNFLGKKERIAPLFHMVGL
jgi:hypothetical protein